MDPSTQASEPNPNEAEQGLDPRGAAALLDRTDRQARREFDTHPPVMSALQAGVILVIYGALWTSVRGQHPYRGPSLGTVGIVYILVAVVALAAVATYHRATQGVSGRSRREDRILAIPTIAAIVGFYTFLGALAHDGFGNAIVYGVVDAAGPWIVMGALLGGVAAAQEDWWKLAGGVAVVAVGTGASFAGPNNVWGVLAVGGCVLLLAQGAVRLTSARRP